MSLFSLRADARELVASKWHQLVMECADSSLVRRERLDQAADNMERQATNGGTNAPTHVLASRHLRKKFKRACV